MRFEDFRKVFAEKKIFDIHEASTVFPGFDRRRLSEWQTTGIFIAGLLHDVGKVAVPLDILANRVR